MLVKLNSIARIVLNETYNSHDVENYMESEINVFEPMDIFDDSVEDIDKTHKPN